MRNLMVQRLVETGDFTERELKGLSEFELFETWCNYEGLVNYASDIINALGECGFSVTRY